METIILVVVPAVILSFALVVVSLLILALIYAWSDLKTHNSFFESYSHSFKEIFDLKFMIALIAITSLVMCWPSYEAHQQCIAEEKGECLCKCKMCKENAHKVNAVVKYLALDEEDIEDLVGKKTKKANNQ